MSAEGFCRWWARCYTRGLPAEARDRRREELDSDLFEHAADAHPHPVGPAILGRTVRGMADDLLWRLREGHTMRANNGNPSRLRAAWATATQAWFAPLAVLVGVFNLVLAGAIAFDSENNKMPGQVVGPLVITALTVLLFLGLHRRSQTGRQPAANAPAGTPVPINPWSTATVGVLAVVAAALVAIGMTGAVSLFFAGLLGLVASGLYLLRLHARSQPARSDQAKAALRADVLIVAGAIPALAMWWMIVPAVVALAVIGGVLGTGRGTAPQLAT